jgi:hypothetical protein
MYYDITTAAVLCVYTLTVMTFHYTPLMTVITAYHFICFGLIWLKIHDYIGKSYNIITVGGDAICLIALVATTNDVSMVYYALMNILLLTPRLVVHCLPYMQPPPYMMFHLPVVSTRGTCSICWEAMNYAGQLPCGHQYHRECIKKWFQTQLLTAHRMTCPICRSVNIVI